MAISQGRFKVAPPCRTLQGEGIDEDEAQPPRASACSVTSTASLSQDATLRAIAGKHARHFVPESLPWQMVLWITRVIQLCWLVCAVLSALEAFGVWVVDYQRPAEHEAGKHGHELLMETLRLSLMPVSMEWPHGRMFSPQALACSARASGELLVSTPFALYETVGQQLGRSLQDAGVVDMSPTTSPLCASAPRGGDASCILVDVEGSGLVFWPLGEDRSGPSTRQLPIEGPAWRLVAGGVVRCDDARGLAGAALEATADSCLLLAGWDGQMLVVAVVPSEAGPGSLPPRSAAVRPTLDVQLDVDDPDVVGSASGRRGAGLPASGAARQPLQPMAPVALSFEPRSGRLWALLEGGSLEVWDLYLARHLGGWRPRWTVAAGTPFEPLALCDGGDAGVFVAGRCSTGPMLLHTPQPYVLPLRRGLIDASPADSGESSAAA